MGKVSIIVPVYNVHRYLCQCLDSIKLQSYQNWEVILVDDGSDDGSERICDTYAEADTRFQVIHKANGGAASAKNIGLERVTGSFVAFVDSDDFVESNWLELLVSTMKEMKADVVEYNFDMVYKTKSKKPDQFLETWKSFSTEEYLAQYLDNWTNSLFWNKLFRKELLDNIRFRKERRCIDDEFFTYKALTGAKSIIRIPQVLYHYRQRVSSVVSSENNQLQITDDALEVLIERFEWIGNRYPDLKTIYLRHDIDVLFYFSTFQHNKQTVKKFQKIAKYYLKEVVATAFDFTLIRKILKLQYISIKLLFNKKRKYAVESDLKQYFE